MEFHASRSQVSTSPIAPVPGERGSSVNRRGSGATAVRRPVSGTPSSDALIQTFNSWAFKREHPDNVERLRSLAHEAIAQHRPLGFVLYWGRGPREGFAPPERQCLDYLSQLARRVASLHAPGADVTIIFTDTHAMLNGYGETSTRRYFAEIEREATKRDFKCCYLSDVVAWAEDRIDAERAEEAPSAEILSQLTVSAAKWYRGEGEYEDGARRYYKSNMIEKQAVEAVFKESVFVTFNGSEHRALFPDRMPIFFMYSIRRGVSVKPWFMASTPESAIAEPECA